MTIKINQRLFDAVHLIITIAFMVSVYFRTGIVGFLLLTLLISCLLKGYLLTRRKGAKGEAKGDS